MNGVKGFNRELEPTTMHSLHPAMSKHKNTEPDKKNYVVDTSTPEKKVSYLINRHRTPLCAVLESFKK
jgi:hypothetical protein